jgi:hypothetical protein
MLLFSFSFNMIVFVYTKKKQTIALSCRIKDFADIIEIKPCSIYILSGRKYVSNQALSGCYFKYYRK